MGDFILRTRVEVLKRNLERIVELESTSEQRRKSLADLQQTTVSVHDAALELVSKVLVTRLAWGRGVSEADAKAFMMDIDGDLARLASSAQKANDELKALHDGYLMLPGPRQDVADFLIQQAREVSAKLDAGTYNRVRAECETLFAEYVEILRGVALREAGLREHERPIADLFRLAEALPDLWGRLRGHSWRSVAVPTTAELRGCSTAFVLRIGFPEWTLWALPLVQQEFAHVFRTWGPVAAPSGESPTDAEAALADAAATLVTGPAYACAAFCFRLDPASPPDSVRAAAIIAALRRAAEGKKHDPLEEVVERLAAEWRDAVRAVEPGPDIVTRATELTEKGNPEVDAIVSAAVPLVPLGASPGVNAPGWAVRWPTVSKWSEALIAAGDPTSLAEEAAADTEGLAMILDAAWLCRFGWDEANDVGDSDDLERIASDAMTLAVAVLDRHQGAAEGRGRGRTPVNRPSTR